MKYSTIDRANNGIDYSNRENLVKILGKLSEEKEKLLLTIRKIDKEIDSIEDEVQRVLVAYEEGTAYRLYDLPQVEEGFSLQPKLEILDEEMD